MKKNIATDYTDFTEEKIAAKNRVEKLFPLSQKNNS